MPETRYVKVHDGEGNVVAEEPYEVSDEELHEEALVHQFNDAHVQGLQAYNNWGSLTTAQRNIILKNLLGYVLWKEGWL